MTYVIGLDRAARLSSRKPVHAVDAEFTVFLSISHRTALESSAEITSRP